METPGYSMNYGSAEDKETAKKISAITITPTARSRYGYTETRRIRSPNFSTFRVAEFCHTSLDAKFTASVGSVSDHGRGRRFGIGARHGW